MKTTHSLLVKQRVLLTALVILIHLLSACSEPRVIPQPPGATAGALFSSSDIAKALEVSESSYEEIIGIELNDEVAGIELPYDELAGEAEASEVSSQAVLAGVAGWLVAYRVNSAGVYEIVRYDQSNNAITVVYSGTEAVQSVGISADGNSVVAALNNPAHGQNDVYLFDIAAGQMYQLSNTASKDETNVSMTADASKIAWQRNQNGKERPYICNYDAASQSCTLSSLGNVDSQVEPSLSANGEYLVLVRLLANGSYQIRRYNFSSSSYTYIATRPDPLADPSVDDSGNRIMYLRTRANGRDYVRIRDLSAGTYETELSFIDGMGHPYITRDGDYATYELFFSVVGKNVLRTRDLMSNSAANPAGGNWDYFQPVWMMAEPNPAVIYNVDLELVGSGMTASRIATFQSAAARWEAVITADIPDFTFPQTVLNPCGFGSSLSGVVVDDLLIFARIVPIDGPGNVLGSAGPAYTRGGSRLPITGCMTFDSADVANLEANGMFESVILHEMGHVLGIGTLWDNLNLDGNCPNSFFFTGIRAVAEYVTLGGSGNVPIENGGGSGTQCGHWDEETFNNELMTGYLNGGSANPLSRLTIASLADIGYNVDLSQAEAYSIPPCSPSCLRITTLATENWEHLIKPRYIIDEQGRFIPLD